MIKTSDNEPYQMLMLCYKPKLIRHVKELKSGDYTNRAFSIKPNGHSKPFGANPKYFKIVHRSDGYDYSLGRLLSLPNDPPFTKSSLLLKHPEWTPVSCLSTRKGWRGCPRLRCLNGLGVPESSTSMDYTSEIV